MELVGQLSELTHPIIDLLTHLMISNSQFKIVL